jgi:Flp pilus assembly protein TadG
MMDVHRRSSLEQGPFAGRITGSRGVALIEFALILPLVLILMLATIDFGRLIQTRLILSNVSREGGSIASRQVPVDTTGLAAMLFASAQPLDLEGVKGGLGKLIITRITAAQGAGATPTVTTSFRRGSLVVNSKVGTGATLGLTSAVYNHLLYKETNKTADISEVTVVEVYYKYKPITPLPKFITDMLMSDADKQGLTVWSKAVF